MPFYSVNGIKIDPTVFFRRIFSPRVRSDMICLRKIRRQDKVPFTLLSNSLYVDHNINSGIRQFFAASEARAADNSCVLTASTL